MPAPGNLGRIKGLRRVFAAPLTTDTSVATAFGTAIFLGAQAELTFQEVEQTDDLETSSGIDNSDSYVKALTWGIKFGEKNLDALRLMRGGKLFSDATGGKNIYAYNKGARGGYFGIFGQPDLVEGGPLDYYVALMKCKMEGGQGRTLGRAWMSQDIGGRAFYTLKDKVLWSEAFLTAITDITSAVVLTDLASVLTSGT